SVPSCPGAAFRKTTLAFASASAVLVHHWVRFDARFAQSATLLYDSPKKLPKISPGLSGHVTLPSRGKSPTTSGVPVMYKVFLLETFNGAPERRFTIVPNFHPSMARASQPVVSPPMSLLG